MQQGQVEVVLTAMFKFVHDQYGQTSDLQMISFPFAIRWADVQRKAAHAN